MKNFSKTLKSSCVILEASLSALSLTKLGQALGKTFLVLLNIAITFPRDYWCCAVATYSMKEWQCSGMQFTKWLYISCVWRCFIAFPFLNSTRTFSYLLAVGYTTSVHQVSQSDSVSLFLFFKVITG